MSDADILVALDGSPWSEAATRVAVQLASGDAPVRRVIGVHVVSVVRMTGRRLRDLAGFLGFEPVIVPGKVETFYQDRGRRILAEFEETCRAAGVGCRTVLEQGNVTECLVRLGDQVDLVVIGARGERELGWPGHGGNTVERVVKTLETSALVVPREQQGLRAVALGYDGSAGAAKALRATRHLVAGRSMPVHAVCVSPGLPTPDPLDEVRACFEGTPVQLACHHRQGEPREILAASAEELGCDLLAVGYRGRSVIGDVFLGRVTEWLLRYVKLALLVSR